jgi:Domain of unknown function (DUF5671)
MADKTLVDFVKAALESGQGRGPIAEALEKAGWRKAEIDVALDTFSDVSFPVAVPKPRPYLSAREAFLYLLFFILLAIVAWSLGSLLFALIDSVIDDVAENGYAGGWRESQIRGAMSGLIVGVPLFLWLAYTLKRARAKHADLQRSRIRKWLIYVSLVFAGCTLVGDAISLVYNFLSGDLSARFLLKSFVVALIAGGIFVYFLGDAEQGDRDARTA